MRGRLGIGTERVVDRRHREHAPSLPLRRRGWPEFEDGQRQQRPEQQARDDVGRRVPALDDQQDPRDAGPQPRESPASPERGDERGEQERPECMAARQRVVEAEHVVAVAEERRPLERVLRHDLDQRPDEPRAEPQRPLARPAAAAQHERARGDEDAGQRRRGGIEPEVGDDVPAVVVRDRHEGVGEGRLVERELRHHVGDGPLVEPGERARRDEDAQRRERGTEGGDGGAAVNGEASQRDGDAPGRIRTSDLSLRRRALYPLSYGRRSALVYPPVNVAARIVSLPLAETFTISRESQDVAELVEVAIAHEGTTGYGEAAPTEHYGESAASALAYVEANGASVGDDPFALEQLLERLPAEQYAARAAIDCALHDLQGKLLGQPTWKLLGLPRTGPPTSWTIWLGDPDDMARRAERVAGRYRRL